MRIGIIGAGAIGGFFAARLALAGHDVSVLARGATLQALRERGLRLDSGGRSDAVRPRASENPAELGAHDVLVLAVKAPSLASAMPAAAAMSGPGTVVLPALNGIPWWYFLAASGPLAGRRLASADPDGSIERAIPVERVLGCVVFPSCSTPAPGHVVHGGGERIVLGEPGGGTSERAERIAQAFAQAGFEASASEQMRREVWIKLLGNACFNPVSLITRRHADDLIDDLAIHALYVSMMNETLGVGRAIGLELDIDPAARIAFSRKLGHVRTSMLQDALAGRPVEIDGILGALVEVAQAAGVAVPILGSVLALARAHAREHGLMPGQGDR